MNSDFVNVLFGLLLLACLGSLISLVAHGEVDPIQGFVELFHAAKGAWSFLGRAPWGLW